MNSGGNASRSLKDFNVLQKLGEGSFASVYKVQRTDDKKLYAMKKVKISEMRQKQRDNALNQVRVLASICHPNIINYKEAFFDEDTHSLCIVMQLADDGDIQKKVDDHIKNHTYFTESQIWAALIQIAKALQELHSIKIFHRDLKCANIFCTKEQKYKLGDLNVSKVAKKGMARTHTGTPYYTSPQVWKEKPYDSKCDIWSLGCVIYQMASLHPPFKANNLRQLYNKIQKGIFQRIPSFYSQDLNQIINVCLRVNPIQRPSATQMLQNHRVLKHMSLLQKSELKIKNCSSLLGTIFCPRNLKSLKGALPGAKYEQQQNKAQRPKSVDGLRQNGRTNSVKNVNSIGYNSKIIPQIINSPKIGQVPAKDLKYFLVPKRPSSHQKNILPVLSKKQVHSQLRQIQNSKNISRLARNNSVDSIRKRQNSFENKQKQPIKYQRNGQNIEYNCFINNISQKCKNIQQKVQNLVNQNYNNNRPGQRYQKVSNSYQKKYNLLRDQSLKSREQQNRSRNNSIQVRKQQKNQYSRQLSSRGSGDKSLQRMKSIQRTQKPVAIKINQQPRNILYKR